MGAKSSGGSDAHLEQIRWWIVLFGGIGLVSGVAAVVVAVAVVGGLAAGIVASILPTLGLIRATKLKNSAPALIVIAVAALVGVVMLLNNTGATQLGVAVLLFLPVVAGEAIRCARRTIRGRASSACW